MEAKTVNLYIVTSMRGPSKRPGACLYILETQTTKGPATITNTIGMENANENGAALEALTAALKRLKQPCSLNIYLDAQYIAAALENRWYQKWKFEGWKNAKGKPVCDVAKWQEIEYLLSLHDFRVRLKTGHPYRDWMEREVRTWSA